MNPTKNFILKNLLKLRDYHGEINNEAVDNLVDAFRDELYQLRDADELSQKYEQGSVLREEAFEEWAREQFISLTY